MKPFDLEKALAGEPVKLRNGNKAFVLARIPDTEVKLNGEQINLPLLGYRYNENGKFDSIEQWTNNGNFAVHEAPHALDIIGMWQEPRTRVQLDLPAPLKSLEGLALVYCPVLDKDIHGNVIQKVYEFDEAIFQEKSIQGQLENGNLFATKQDAQEWLDAMRNARK